GNGDIGDCWINSLPHRYRDFSISIPYTIGIMPRNANGIDAVINEPVKYSANPTIKAATPNNGHGSINTILYELGNGHVTNPKHQLLMRRHLHPCSRRIMP
ncbi:hypothetical protein, partial [Caldivirga sp.]|uniref:hypothetical protein n=1 Tax=Caldivirga sp. TaxID=2080243 RepID=UPI003D115038